MEQTQINVVKKKVAIFILVCLESLVFLNVVPLNVIFFTATHLMLIKLIGRLPMKAEFNHQLYITGLTETTLLLVTVISQML